MKLSGIFALAHLTSAASMTNNRHRMVARLVNGQHDECSAFMRRNADNFEVSNWSKIKPMLILTFLVQHQFEPGHSSKTTLPSWVGHLRFKLLHSCLRATRRPSMCGRLQHWRWCLRQWTDMPTRPPWTTPWNMPANVWLRKQFILLEYSSLIDF